jgi:surfeit locus 1 family protein
MTKSRVLGPVMTWTFVVLMSILAVVCFWLGGWQMDRLAEKDALIAAVDERVGSAPIPVPAASDWPQLDLEPFNFQPVELTGRFRYGQTVKVFTSLADANGQYSGPGYWVMTPLGLSTGGTVWVNRGFVPQTAQDAVVTASDTDAEIVVVTGLLRPGEDVGFAVPDPDRTNRVEWVRNIARLSAMADPNLAPFAPFYVDMPAGAPGELPQGGETVMNFSNNHLGYAYTWYGFSIVAVVMLGFWFFRQRASAKE